MNPCFVNPSINSSWENQFLHANPQLAMEPFSNYPTPMNHDFEVYPNQLDYANSNQAAELSIDNCATSDDHADAYLKPCAGRTSFGTTTPLGPPPTVDASSSPPNVCHMPSLPDMHFAECHWCLICGTMTMIGAMANLIAGFRCPRFAAISPFVLALCPCRKTILYHRSWACAVFAPMRGVGPAF